MFSSQDDENDRNFFGDGDKSGETQSYLVKSAVTLGTAPSRRWCLHHRPLTDSVRVAFPRLTNGGSVENHICY